MPSQNAFPSMVSPHNQFNNRDVIGNVPNVSSLIHQSFANGGPSSGHPVTSSSPYMSPPVTSNHNSSGQGQQLDPQFSVPSNPQQLPHQQVANEQARALRNVGPVKLEPQQLQGMRSAGSVKMEPQNLDPSLFLHQQQQQQQLLLSRQSSQAAAAAQIMHEQRLMQIQQHQLLKSMPQPRSPLQPQFQHQNLPNRSPVKHVYEPGMCARRLTHYMYEQQRRPEDNNIEFWRNFVAEFFVPNAKKKWCVSMYGSGRQTTGVFPQDVWHCEICNHKPGRGFEATAEVLPRLFKIKYESGTLEELLFVDMPQESQNSSGKIILDYGKAVQESVFEQFRVVRDGRLRIVFSPDLKICSWEFCARSHEELIPRRLLIPQVGQLGAAAQKCQAATENASSSASASELQNSCNIFVASARQLAKTLEVPLNDLGYTKRYVRCLQISEVLNTMKDLIDYSHQTGTGPMESLAKFSQSTNPSSGFQGQPQQTDGGQQQQRQQTMGQNTKNNPVQTAASNGRPNGSNSVNSMPATSSSDPIAGLPHQNPIKQHNSVSNANSPYRGNTIQMSSPGSSSTVPQTQLTSLSAFLSPTPSSFNNPQPDPHGTSSGVQVNSPNTSVQQQPSLSGDADMSDSQTSVQRIINGMMMSPRCGGSGTMGMGMVRGDMQNVDGAMNRNNGIVGPRVANGNTGIGGLGSRNASNGLSQSVNGLQAAVRNNSLSLNGRIGMTTGQHQQDSGDQLLCDLGTINDFNDLQFDWKSSP